MSVRRGLGAFLLGSLFAALTVGVALVPAPGRAADPQKAPSVDSAASFLRVELRFAAKCSGLQRGKMRFLQNHHPERPVRYRMARYLGDTRQPSLIADSIEPGEEGRQDLGCELLDGLEQNWRVLKAEFQEAQP